MLSTVPVCRDAGARRGAGTSQGECRQSGGAVKQIARERALGAQAEREVS